MLVFDHIMQPCRGEGLWLVGHRGDDARDLGEVAAIRFLGIFALLALVGVTRELHRFTDEGHGSWAHFRSYEPMPAVSCRFPCAPSCGEEMLRHEIAEGPELWRGVAALRPQRNGPECCVCLASTVTSVPSASWRRTARSGRQAMPGPCSAMVIRARSYWPRPLPADRHLWRRRAKTTVRACRWWRSGAAGRHGRRDRPDSEACLSGPDIGARRRG